MSVQVEGWLRVAGIRNTSPRPRPTSNHVDINPNAIGNIPPCPCSPPLLLLLLLLVVVVLLVSPTDDDTVVPVLVSLSFAILVGSVPVLLLSPGLPRIPKGKTEAGCSIDEEVEMEMWEGEAAEVKVEIGSASVCFPGDDVISFFKIWRQEEIRGDI